MRFFQDSRTLRAGVALGSIGAAMLFGHAAQAEGQTPDACELDGTASGPCSIGIQLGDRPLARAFPFDVPVFLTGTADDAVRQLKLHVFSAPQSFSLAESCTDATLPLEQCPDDQHELRCSRHAGSKAGGPQPTWTFANLQGTNSGSAPCTLQAQVSVWKRASPNDDTFTLQVPPLPANRYFVLFLEEETTPSTTQLTRLKSRLAAALDKAIEGALNNQGGNFGQWSAGLHDGICREVHAAARAEGLRFEVPDGSLLDCSGGGVNDRLRNAATSALFNDLADVQQQLRVILDQRSQLTNNLSQLPNLQSLPDELGFDLPQLNSPTFRIELSGLEADLPDRLAAESARLGTLPGFKDASETIADAAGKLEQSLAGYAELQEITSAIAESTVILSGSNIGSFLTRQKAYLAADFGVLYAFDVDQALPYIGTNVYLFPVNKQAPLAWNDGWGLRGKRYSVTVGVTLGEFSKDRADPLVSTMNLVTGIGIRVTESIRLGGGAVWYREADKNTLSTEKKTVYSPYVSFSFDYDVSSLIKWFAKLFP